MTKPVEKTIHMTKRQWRKWDKALRSGEIKQTRAGWLIDAKDGSMCCLGVLEYALEGEVEHTVGFPTQNFCRRNGIKFFDKVLNEVTSNHYDFGNSPYLTGGYAHELNDDRNLSFKQIAERIKHRVKFIPEKKKK